MAISQLLLKFHSGGWHIYNVHWDTKFCNYITQWSIVEYDNLISVPTKEQYKHTPILLCWAVYQYGSNKSKVIIVLADNNWSHLALEKPLYPYKQLLQSRVILGFLVTGFKTSSFKHNIHTTSGNFENYALSDNSFKELHDLFSNWKGLAQ